MRKIKIPEIYNKLQGKSRKPSPATNVPSDKKLDSFAQVIDAATAEVRESDSTLNRIMAVKKNPSTIFKPPFGINVHEHHSRLGEHAKNLWKYNKITDITVKLQGTDYPCHKTVLSCYSKYFKDMLLEEEGTVKTIHLRLPSITKAAFEVLLKYMYTSDLDLTCQNIGEVYTAARKLGVDGVLVLCTEIFTGKSKRDVNSVYIYVTAKKERMRKCAAKAMKVMTERFEHIVGTPEFLDLNFNQVREYLNQDVLATRSEVIVYLAALKWLHVKFLEREEHAIDLLNCVRFQMMTLNEILACYSPPLLPGILEHKKITDKLLAATCYVAAQSVNEEKRFKRFACNPRRYLLKREPMLLWDPSIFDPDRHAMYKSEMAATVIQAGYRGWKTRQKVTADKEAGILTIAEPKKLSEVEFEPPRDAKDQTYIEDSRRYSFVDNLRKSIGSFLGYGGEEIKPESSEGKERQKKGEKKKTQSDKIPSPSLESRSLEETQPRPLEETESRSVEETEPRSVEETESRSLEETEPRSVEEIESRSLKETDSRFLEETEPKSLGDTALRRSSSIDTLVDHVNKVAELTELETHTLDTPLNMNSKKFKSTIRKLGMLTKSYPNPTISKDVRRSDERKESAQELISNSSAEEDAFLEKASGGYILAAGGYTSGNGDDSDGHKIFLYDVAKNTWKRYGHMGKSRHHHCLVLVNKEVYFIGGCSTEQTNSGHMTPDKECFKFNIETKEWSKVSKLKRSRMYHGSAGVGGKIYVVGGKDHKERLLSSVEIYDLESNKWEELDDSLELPTMGVGVCAHEEKIWVVGGMVPNEDGTLRTINEVRCYDPAYKTWSHIKPLPSPRAFATPVSFENTVYVIGGTSQSAGGDEPVLTSIADVLYLKKEKKWRTTTSLPSPRHFVEASAVGDTLYVLGGLASDQKEDINDLIKYELKNRTWRPCALLPENVCGFAAVSIPPHL